MDHSAESPASRALHTAKSLGLTPLFQSEQGQSPRLATLRSECLIGGSNGPSLIPGSQVGSIHPYASHVSDPEHHQSLATAQESLTGSRPGSLNGHARSRSVRRCSTVMDLDARPARGDSMNGQAGASPRQRLLTLLHAGGSEASHDCTPRESLLGSEAPRLSSAARSPRRAPVVPASRLSHYNVSPHLDDTSTGGLADLSALALRSLLCPPCCTCLAWWIGDEGCGLGMLWQMSVCVFLYL